ncbi:MAG: aminotransferase class I/II-fold pyridoxal phosphate-dependent enzyme, partial [Kangiellaceae bacterium]|nr:aminotransferase class I/II-fold pyridoxal phosphate-dependent enzyme [Kangiellaceae bacterium]
FFTSELLQNYAEKLLQINGWLIVDEAFTEAAVENSSLLPFVKISNVIVLRSIGKFFGLAGIRAGFATSLNKAIISELAEVLGPWRVSGPTQYIVEKALSDNKWQLEQKQKHRLQSEKLMSVLTEYFSFEAIKGCQLFKTISHSAAEELHELLCSKRIYVRLCNEKNAIRIGLPDDIQLEKLELALSQLASETEGLKLNEA